MNKWLELLIGLILMIGAILLALLTLNLGIANFGTPAFELLKGGVVWIIGFIGILFILLGIADLKG